MKRAASLLIFGLLVASAAFAQSPVVSVEFPWNHLPRPEWDRELVWLHNIGVRHVSLSPAPDAETLNTLLTTIRRLGMEADLETPVPASLELLLHAHGGPLTAPIANPVRISLLAEDALARSRKALDPGSGGIIWTDVEDTLGPDGYHAGAVNFAGEERDAATILRRVARFEAYWSGAGAMHDVSGSGLKPAQAGVATRQVAAANEAALLHIVNDSAKDWSGEVHALYAPAKRMLTLPGISMKAHSALSLPINVPLSAGPLCKACSAFATVDHLIYATAELTAMEYENGILAMEFTAPAKAEVVLQMSREPSGPYMAAGHPVAFDWDESNKRARMSIPAGPAPGHHIRVSLAIDAPDATAFFPGTRVLLIGETNTLNATFSSEAVAQRSRLRIRPEYSFTEAESKDPLVRQFQVKIPDTAVPGDHAELAIEADGMQMSHETPQLLKPATLRYPDAIQIHLAQYSDLPLTPAVIPVPQRAGREVAVLLRNNAPEIRNFSVEMKADGLTFSPAKLDISIGAAMAREVRFRVFASDATTGLHSGEVHVTGAATVNDALRFVVIPATGAIAWQADGFTFLESLKERAAFMPGRWLEWIGKSDSKQVLPPGGVPLAAEKIEVAGDAVRLDGRTIRIEDLNGLPR